MTVLAVLVVLVFVVGPIWGFIRSVKTQGLEEGLAARDAAREKAAKLDRRPSLR